MRLFWFVEYIGIFYIILEWVLYIDFVVDFWECVCRCWLWCFIISWLRSKVNMVLRKWSWKLILCFFVVVICFWWCEFIYWNIFMMSLIVCFKIICGWLWVWYLKVVFCFLSLFIIMFVSLWMMMWFWSGCVGFFWLCKWWLFMSVFSNVIDVVCLILCFF